MCCDLVASHLLLAERLLVQRIDHEVVDFTVLLLQAVNRCSIHKLLTFLPAKHIIFGTSLSCLFDLCHLDAKILRRKYQALKWLTLTLTSHHIHICSSNLICSFPLSLIWSQFII